LALNLFISGKGVVNMNSPEERYFAELSLRLRQLGFEPESEEDGLLPVKWEGERLCRFEPNGTMRYCSPVPPEKEPAGVFHGHYPTGLYVGGGNDHGQIEREKGQGEPMNKKSALDLLERKLNDSFSVLACECVADSFDSMVEAAKLGVWYLMTDFPQPGQVQEQQMGGM